MQTRSGQLPPTKTAPPAVVQRRADGSQAEPLPFTGIPAELAEWAFLPGAARPTPQALVQAKPAAPAAPGQAPVQAMELSWRGLVDGTQELASDAMELASDAIGFVGEQANEVIDDVAAWGIDQINSLQDLMLYVARVGEDAAKWLMAQIIEHKVEIAVAFLSANPSSLLAVFVICRLPRDVLQSWLASTSTDALETVIKTAIVIGSVAAVAGAIFVLGQSSIPLIKTLTPALLAALWQHVPEELRLFVQQVLVEYWPVGLGFALDGSIGATFGYPIHLGAEAYFEISHFTAGHFTLKRGGMLTEALDTGVGVGGYVGLGGSKPGTGGGGDKSGLGIGGEAGAQAQAGLRQAVHQEFDFPVLQDDAFLAFLLAVAGNDIGAPDQVVELFSRQLRNVQPDSYNTKTKFELKAFAEGNAAASAGLRTGGENTQEGRSTWTNRDGAADTGKTKWWQRWLRAGIFGRIALEAGVGLESENQEWREDADGVRVPAKIKVEASGEASAALALVHSLPVISQALPAGINFDGGAGIKVAWILTGGVDDSEPQVSSPTYSLYAKTGNLDRYQGAASETSIAIGSVSADTFASLDAFLNSISAGAEIKRRFNVGLEIGRKYFLAAQRAGAFNVMLPADYRNYGFRVEGYIDLDAQLSAEQVRSVFRSIVAVNSSYQAGGAPLQKLYQDVMIFIATGDGPPEVMQQFEAIANHVLAGLHRLHLHGLVGVSAAVGAHLSAMGKVRLKVHLGTQITMDHDLQPYVSGIVTLEDIRELLRNPDPGGDSELEVAGDVK
ncbi:MAG: hypothetical protein Tsb0020_35750 [Haliangiales bacterium]